MRMAQWAMAEKMAAGWGSGPSEGLVSKIGEELQNYMLDELSAEFDPFGIKAEIRSNELDQRREFLVKRILVEFENQHIRDLEEMDRARAEESLSLRVDLDLEEPRTRGSQVP